MKGFKLEAKPILRGVTCDSREVKAGYAFVAISGFNQDGNNYIDEAVENGASLIITEKEIETEVPVIKVKNARYTLGILAASFYENPSHKINLIGVTGTNGKTTSTSLIYHLLNYNNNTKQAGLIGTVDVDTGQIKYPGNLTTPPPVQLQRYLREMVDNGLPYACMEVSSHGIKLHRIAGIQFDVKVGTNISMDHFDLHSSFSEYSAVKRDFLEDAECNLVLINKDDSTLTALIKDTDNKLGYAVKGAADITASGIKTRGYKTAFNYHLNTHLTRKDGRLIPETTLPIEMNLIGEHNIYNALIAITIALYYDLEPVLIQEFFREFTGIWRRLQVLYQNGLTIIDDCAHNPGSYQAVLQTVNTLIFRQIYLINSLRGNRGVKINRQNAAVISRLLPELGDYTLLTTNCNDVVKPVDRVYPAEEKVFLDTLSSSNINFIHYQELQPALEYVQKKAGTDDLILLLGPHAMDNAGEMLLEMMGINIS